MNSSMLFSEPWAAAVTNHLWQSTLIAGLAWLLRFVLRGAPARARFWIWMAASIKFVLPFALVSVLATSIASHTQARFVIPAQGSEHSVALLAQTLSHPVQGHGRVSVLSEDAAPVHPWQSAQHIVFSALLAVWFAGVVVLAASWFRQWLEICRAVSTSTPIRFHLAEGLDVRVSNAAMEPGVFGILQPVLLLPEGLIAELPEVQLRAIVEHERTHIRRRDNLTATVHMIIMALFWFHPAVWWIRARLLEERERACDEAVLDSGNAAELYAESILSVCRLYVESPLPCLSGITGSDLKRRIVHIMSGEAPRTLGVRRRLILAGITLAVILFPALSGLTTMDRVHAQTAPAANVPTAYDVISIHPRKPGSDNMGISFGDGKFDGDNVNLMDLLCNAYGIRSGLVFGVPSWADGRRWDIHAKMVDLSPEEMKKLNLTDDQNRQFVVNMLAERFHAKVHWETKQLPVYNLIVDKGGPKFAQNAAQNAEELKGVSPGGMTSNWSDSEHRGVFNQAPIHSLVFSLANALDRDVIDQTGLTEKYSFAIKYAAPNAPPGTDALPSLFPALQEQLGLKLVPAKGPIATLVVDHVDPPTEN
ncbi:TIGR03435 family protein [Silvibacterium sp.]|uniref:TIGR03435 family protein n=1 Tax=Silvibacterium sp. TaxID=1964179 RepID=UPI0039E3D22E